MANGTHAHEVAGAVAPDIGGVALTSFDADSPEHVHEIGGTLTGPPIPTPGGHTHATVYGLSGPPVFKSSLGDLAGGVVVVDSDVTLPQLYNVQPGNAGQFQPFFPLEPDFEGQMAAILQRDTYDQVVQQYPIDRLGSDWGAPDQTFIFGTGANSPSRRGGDGRIRAANVLPDDQALPNPDFNWGDSIHVGLIFEDMQRGFRGGDLDQPLVEQQPDAGPLVSRRYDTLNPLGQDIVQVQNDRLQQTPEERAKTSALTIGLIAAGVLGLLLLSREGI